MSEPQIQLPQNPAQTIEKKTSNNKVKIIAILFVLLIIIAMAIIGVLLLKKYVLDKNTNNEEATEQDEDKEEENDKNKADETEIITTVLTITSPLENDEVNGRIEVTGKSSKDIESFQLRISDSNDLVLGQTAITTSDEDNINDWSAELNVTKSPGTLGGYIRAIPDNTELLDFTDIINIKFEGIANDRVKLYTPISEQVMYGTSVLFRGQMKDFFEGLMSVRLIDESGDILYQGHINADSVNYDRFADFNKVIEYGVIPVSAGDQGTWEIYEISMADDSEAILLTVDVRFIP